MVINPMKPLLAEFKDAQARRHPRVVQIEHIRKGVVYNHTSPFLGTRNAQSYLPGAHIKKAVITS